MSDQSGRLFPESMEAAFKRLPWRLGGGAIIAASLAGYVSLLTWSIHDPSLNHATGAPATNLLGRPGAILADLLMQSVGLAAAALLLPPVIWGWNLAQGTVLKQRTTRFIYWAVAATLFASALGALAVPKAWALSHGLGGVLGDVFSRPFFWLGGFIEPRYAGQIGAGVASALGFWALCRTLEYKLTELLLLFAGFSREKPKTAPQRKRYYLPEAEKTQPASFTARLTSALRKRFLALWKQPAPPVVTGPREFWMRDGQAAAAAQAGAGICVSRGEPKPDAGADELDEDEIDGVPPHARVEPHFGPLKQGAPRTAASNAPPARTQAPYSAPREAPRSHARPRQGTSETARSASPKGGISSANDNFVLPPLKLLSEPQATSAEAVLSDEELRTRAAELEAVLDDFGVKGRISRIHPGPVITLYELEPARGTKSSRVIGLADDIARSMSAVSARVAVIPGRDAIGIELPNQSREIVYLRELLSHDEFNAATRRSWRWRWARPSAASR